MKEKKLTINGQLIAIYEIDGDHLFLNMKNDLLFKRTPAINENAATSLIEKIENRKINKLSYLNIHKKPKSK